MSTCPPGPGPPPSVPCPTPPDWANPNCDMKLKARDPSFIPPEAVCYRDQTGKPIKCNGFGQGFNLHNTAISPSNMMNGTNIFTPETYEYGGACVQGNTLAAEPNSDIRTFDSTQQIVKSMSTDNSIGGSYSNMAFSVKASVDTQTKTDSTADAHIQSAVYDYRNYSATLNFDRSCIKPSNLNPALIADFCALPVFQLSVGYLFNPADFVPYQNFFTNWGTHVLTNTKIGHRFLRTDSLSSTDSNTARILTVKECLDASVNSGVNTASMSQCSNITDSEKTAASQLTTQNTKYAWGGDPYYANRLQDPCSTQDDAQGFIKSSPHLDTNIGFSFIPIWEVLLTAVTFGLTCPQSPASMVQRVNNLQVCYEGYMAQNCSTRTGHDGNDIIQGLQVKQISADGTNAVWGCFWRHDGCYNDDDCHYNWNDAACKCDGNGCYSSNNNGPPVFNNTSWRYDVPSGACSRPTIFTECACHGIYPNNRWSYVQGNSACTPDSPCLQ